MSKRVLFAGLALCAFAGTAAADCPPMTVADMKGVKAGAFPQQYELAEFESVAGCKLAFAGNPKSADLNGRIQGNGALPALAAAGLAHAAVTTVEVPESAGNSTQTRELPVTSQFSSS